VAEGTQEAVDAAAAGIIDGSIQVFDTSTFTVGGEELTQAYALDTDGDFVPDTEEAVFDGAYHESYFQSAPYFAMDIDGITLLN
jgi:basic membrane protein A